MDFYLASPPVSLSLALSLSLPLSLSLAYSLLLSLQLHLSHWSLSVFLLLTLFLALYLSLSSLSLSLSPPPCVCVCLSLSVCVAVLASPFTWKGPRCVFLVPEHCRHEAGDQTSSSSQGTAEVGTTAVCMCLPWGPPRRCTLNEHSHTLHVFILSDFMLLLENLEIRCHIMVY